MTAEPRDCPERVDVTPAEWLDRVLVCTGCGLVMCDGCERSQP